MGAALFQPFPMLPGRRAQAWRHQPSYRRPRHFHGEPEINFVSTGKARLGVGDKTVELSAGELILLPPGVDHELLRGSADLTLFVLALTPELAARVYDPLAHATDQIHELDRERCLELEAYLSASSNARNPTSMEAGLAEIFRTTLTTLKPRHTLSRRALLAWAGEQELSETALAARLKVDLGTLSRCLRHDLGAKFVEYRARHRLMTFIAFAERGRPLSSAAIEAGFGSYAQCHRTFARVLGCSPTAYFRGEREIIAERVVTTETSTLPVH
jgi:AraC-like DNA-binding protein